MITENHSTTGNQMQFSLKEMKQLTKVVEIIKCTCTVFIDNFTGEGEILFIRSKTKDESCGCNIREGRVTTLIKRLNNV